MNAVNLTDGADFANNVVFCFYYIKYSVFFLLSKKFTVSLPAKENLIYNGTTKYIY